MGVGRVVVGVVLVVVAELRGQELTLFGGEEPRSLGVVEVIWGWRWERCQTKVDASLGLWDNAIRVPQRGLHARDWFVTSNHSCSWGS